MFSLGLNIALFDIKLNTPYKGLLFLRGNEYEVESVPFFGEVKLSLNEDVHVKRIHLFLVGEFQYDYVTRGDTYGFYGLRFNDRKCVLRVDWNNLLTSEEGVVTFGNYGDSTMDLNKVTRSVSDARRNSYIEASIPETMPALSRTKSLPAQNSDPQAPESGFDGTPFKDQNNNQQTFVLPKGNYSLPFKIYLPTDICETVEGLAACSIRYRIHCNIERGRFEKTESTSKYLRVIRTLHPQNFNLCESIEINNNWPNKIQYSVNMTKKGIAIGSTIPINVIIVPMIKGLSLHAISCCIVEHFRIQYSLQPYARSPDYEKVIGKQQLTIPKMEDLDYEQWIIKTHYRAPYNLRELTQSCELKNHMISVKHRLRILIKFKNPGGHVSELRVNLPVSVYISANSGFVVGRHYDVDPRNGTFIPNKRLEEVLFPKKNGQREFRRGTHIPIEDENEEESEDEIDLDREEAAPPLYQQHIFDKKYDMNSPQSPLQQTQTHTHEGSPLSSPDNSVLNLAEYIEQPESGDGSIDSDEEADLAPIQTLDAETLSKIPTYAEAFDQDAERVEEQGFAPLYPYSGDLVNGSDPSNELYTAKSNPISRGRRDSSGYRSLSLPRFSHSQERKCEEPSKRRHSLHLGKLFRVGRKSVT